MNAPNFGDVPKVLKVTMSPNNEHRRRAEETLRKLQSRNYGKFILSLLNVICDQKMDGPIRKAAAIFIKNIFSSRGFRNNTRSLGEEIDLTETSYASYEMNVIKLHLKKESEQAKGKKKKNNQGNDEIFQSAWMKLNDNAKKRILEGGLKLITSEKDKVIVSLIAVLLSSILGYAWSNNKHISILQQFGRELKTESKTNVSKRIALLKIMHNVFDVCSQKFLYNCYKGFVTLSLNHMQANNVHLKIISLKMITKLVRFMGDVFKYKTKGESFMKRITSSMGSEIKTNTGVLDEFYELYTIICKKFLGYTWVRKYIEGFARMSIKNISQGVRNRYFQKSIWFWVSLCKVEFNCRQVQMAAYKKWNRSLTNYLCNSLIKAIISKLSLVDAKGSEIDNKNEYFGCIELLSWIIRTLILEDFPIITQLANIIFKIIKNEGPNQHSISMSLSLISVTLSNDTVDQGIDSILTDNETGHIGMIFDKSRHFLERCMKSKNKVIILQAMMCYVRGILRKDCPLIQNERDMIIMTLILKMIPMMNDEKWRHQLLEVVTKSMSTIKRDNSTFKSKFEEIVNSFMKALHKTKSHLIASCSLDCLNKIISNAPSSCIGYMNKTIEGLCKMLNKITSRRPDGNQRQLFYNAYTTGVTELLTIGLKLSLDKSVVKTIITTYIKLVNGHKWWDYILSMDLLTKAVIYLDKEFAPYLLPVLKIALNRLIPTNHHSWMVASDLILVIFDEMIGVSNDDSRSPVRVCWKIKIPKNFIETLFDRISRVLDGASKWGRNYNYKDVYSIRVDCLKLIGGAMVYLREDMPQFVNKACQLLQKEYNSSKNEIKRSLKGGTQTYTAYEFDQINNYTRWNIYQCYNILITAKDFKFKTKVWEIFKAHTVIILLENLKSWDKNQMIIMAPLRLLFLLCHTSYRSIIPLNQMKRMVDACWGSIMKCKGDFEHEGSKHSSIVRIAREIYETVCHLNKRY